MANIQNLTQFDFHHILSHSYGISLVVFTSSYCGACKRIIALLKQYKANDLQIYLINAEEEIGLVNEFEVFHLPSLFLYHNGNFHSPLHTQGLNIKQDIDIALQQPPQEAP